MEGNSNQNGRKQQFLKIEYEKVEVEVEGNSNFKIAISFHSSIFGKMGKKLEWKEIATPLLCSVEVANFNKC